ncbi:uncharacterized protein EV422DRAFT_516699 [Fimicolochytrium jonesii]|uniref:uncharacterized protein n=1 Tax=Fimicolochytrium jonesii TaxID=1396493 RepID=UPI0022FE5289|nr:uncharacterized protein EV422DRAFT_516699 [Fimicolochytrium jonesii]KAI8824899.1 hypothetical protein EV422DRAFT_516699 [Fimicolochytrium jonesii]
MTGDVEVALQHEGSGEGFAAEHNGQEEPQARTSGSSEVESGQVYTDDNGSLRTSLEGATAASTDAIHGESDSEDKPLGLIRRDSGVLPEPAMHAFAAANAGEVEEDEESTLGSTYVKPLETVYEEPEAYTATSERSASPESEPEVLPVLSTGLQPRVSSAQRGTHLKRSMSTPAMVVNRPATLTRTDTSAPELQTTELPTFATPTPIVSVRPLSLGEIGTNMHAPPQFAASSMSSRHDGMPLSDNSRSKQFNQRLDYMVGEFFTRQVTKLATSTPSGMDRVQKILSQRVKEKLGQQMGKQWAHVTAQPEVDEAAKEIESMYSYFSQLEKMVEKQRACLQQLNEVEAELSLFYQQKGYQESDEEIGKNLVHLGEAYHSECKERVPVISSLDSYLGFLKTFKSKAINDSRDTIKTQKTARQEFDSYASRLGYLEEKNVQRAATLSPGSMSSSSSRPFGFRSKSSEDTQKYQEKELDQTRRRFQAAKTRYQVLSTQIIDKAGLLEMKRAVDFGAYLAKVVEAHDAHNGFRPPIRKASSEPLPLPDAVEATEDATTEGVTR